MQGAMPGSGRAVFSIPVLRNGHVLEQVCKDCIAHESSESLICLNMAGGQELERWGNSCNWKFRQWCATLCQPLV
jgi:hypothetical protein